VVALALPALGVPVLVMPSCIVNTPVVEGDDGGMGGAGAESGSGGMPQGGSSVGGRPTGGASGASTGGVTTGGSSPTGGAPPTGGALPTGGSGGFPPGCEPQRVAGEGPCTLAIGVFFFGSTCGWLGGCSCVGEDCDNAYESEEACLEANRECLDDCRPQEATFTGLCEELPRKVFTGVECVEMNGCDCIGIDCDYTYPTASDPPPSCEATHAHCLEKSRSCNELSATYQEYSSRDACEDDTDCQINEGHCSVGIGSCYHPMNRQWPADGLATLAAEFVAAECTVAVCDCAPTPTTVQCVDGRCVPGDE
jgi:hypothetical protein